MKKFTRILIVDDENIFRNTLRNLISWEDEGFLVVGFAENGMQALSLLDATMPQIVITDIAMPIMNGVELLCEIERRNTLPQNTNNKIETIVISGFDTFCYVRDAMKHGAFDYILKSELNAATLIQRLNNLVACMPEPEHSSNSLDFSQFFSNLMNHNYSNMDFVQDKLLEYGVTLQLNEPLFLIKSFCSDTTEEYVQVADARRILFEKFQNLPIAVFIYQESCMILGNMCVLNHTLVTLSTHSEDYPSLYWGVYENFGGLENNSKMIADFAQIPQQFFYAPNKKIFYYQANLTFGIPAVVDTALIVTSVTKSDFQAVLSFLGDFLAECVKNKIYPYALRKYCEQAVYSVLFAIEKSSPNLPSLNIKKIEYFQRIDLASTIDELCDVLDGVLSDIFSLNTPVIENTSVLIANINQYIDENYMLPLRLSDVADHVHISYHHLSRIINTYYHEPFNAYLNSVRIKVAQNLIRTTALPMGRIAEDVGFANQSYFGKIFKKQVGISPRLYRLQISRDLSK